MRTNLSCCLGLIDNGQYKSTNRLLVLVPHERPHGIMRILKNPCMLLPKALKMRAIKDTMALVADSIGGTKGAPAQMSWHLRHLNPALLNRQGMSTHPKMENGSELCHWKGQLIVGLCVDPVRPCKPPQIGAKLPKREREILMECALIFWVKILSLPDEWSKRHIQSMMRKEGVWPDRMRGSQGWLIGGGGGGNSLRSVESSALVTGFVIADQQDSSNSKNQQQHQMKT